MSQHSIAILLFLSNLPILLSPENVSSWWFISNLGVWYVADSENGVEIRRAREEDVQRNQSITRKAHTLIMARFIFFVLFVAILGIARGGPCLSSKARMRKCNILKTLSKADKSQKPVALCVLKTCLRFPAKRLLNKKTGKRTLCIDDMGLTKAVNKALQRCLKKGRRGVAKKTWSEMMSTISFRTLHTFTLCLRIHCHVAAFKSSWLTVFPRRGMHPEILLQKHDKVFLVSETKAGSQNHSCGVWCSTVFHDCFVALPSRNESEWDLCVLYIRNYLCFVGCEAWYYLDT